MHELIEQAEMNKKAGILVFACGVVAIVLSLILVETSVSIFAFYSFGVGFPLFVLGIAETVYWTRKYNRFVEQLKGLPSSKISACPRCGKQILQGDFMFCPFCGSPLAPLTP